MQMEWISRLCAIVASVKDKGMTEILVWVRGLLAAVLKGALWLTMAVAALFLLALGLVLLLLGFAWALLRGQKPVKPVFVGRFQRFTAQRVWPRAGQRPGGTDRADVVDVEVREVDAPSLPPQTPAKPPGSTGTGGA
jgi:hypothetical protein